MTGRALEREGVTAGLVGIYHRKGFGDQEILEEIGKVKCKKPLPGAKAGTLKEKNEKMMKLINSVEKKSGDIAEVSGRRREIFVSSLVIHQSRKRQELYRLHVFKLIKDCM